MFYTFKYLITQILTILISLATMLVSVFLITTVKTAKVSFDRRNKVD